MNENRGMGLYDFDSLYPNSAFPPNTNISGSRSDVAIPIANHNLFAGTVLSRERLRFPWFSLGGQSNMESTE
jgi:hypothetical protein